MDLWHSLSGMVEVKLVSPDLPGAMEMLRKAQVPVQDLVLLDDFQLRFFMERNQFSSAKKWLEKRGHRLEICRRRGIYFLLRRLLNRPVLTLGLLTVFLFSLWVPTRVFFLQVEGNTTIPSRQIMEAAGACGIGFGTSRRELRSEKVKNALLAAMPQLQWAGVNTYGCKAVITVRERTQVQQQMQNGQVSSIVALRDAVIREMTVLKGNALCQPGQAVKAGEVLVSGYVDHGICIQAGPSIAEIYGDTQRRLTAVIPTEYDQRTKITASTKKYSLIFGKKRINLFKGSGILGTTCAKIYEENYLTLPGGFVLPVAIAWEQWYEFDTICATETKTEQILSDFATDYLTGQMLAGKITLSNQLFFHDDSYCTLEGQYSCYEMIGFTRPEEHLNE